MIIINNVPTEYTAEFPCEMDFILPHKLINDENYKNYYVNKLDDVYKILDNSVFELGESLNPHILFNWAALVNAHEIIIPDVYGDMKKTLRAMEDFLDEKESNRYNLMAVPQGKNQEELIMCLHVMVKNPRIYSIGFNKLWDRKTWEGYIQQTVKYKQVHLLGTNKLSDWVLGCADIIRSADSRVLSKLVTGTDSEVWEQKLNNTQKQILHNLINEVYQW